MKYLYNTLMYISEKLILFFGIFFGQKTKYFVQGQREAFKKLSHCIQTDKTKVWFHVSSLGEYEQALPIIEKIKKHYPDYQLILTFFSPSGYEVIKKHATVDCISYLPWDTLKNVRKFLDLIQPKLVFFVKYDFWPNYLYELKKRNIPVYLIAGLFRANHSFFKPYNAWLKKSLSAFHHFFVQDVNSKNVLIRQGFSSVTVTGDTRFDRVYQLAQTSNNLEFIEHFKQNQPLLVAGSTWKTDENILIPIINENNNFKTVIAPHNISDNHIKSITKQIKKPYILFTEITENKDLSNFDVLIINQIGLLKTIYRYADVVYIGNGFGKSIHNIQEPAVYGVPIITGPNIDKFNEAVDLNKLGGLTVVHNEEELKKIIDKLFSNEYLRKQQAQITRDYVQKNIGSSQLILDYLKDKL